MGNLIIKPKKRKLLLNQTSQSSFSNRPIIFRREGERESFEVFQTYQMIDGRVFRMDNKRYPMPCDAPEKKRLHMQHYIFKEVWNGNFSSPIHERLKQGMRVLDSGCGVGSWTLDMANEYPASTFVGVDVIEVAPINIRPSNAELLQFNLLNGILFPNETFDFIYQRFLWAAFTESQWITLVDELIRVTKTGGWIELTEFQAKIYNPGPIAKKLSDAAQQHLSLNGINPKIHLQIPKIMADTNKFTSIESIEKIIPLGNWQETSRGIKVLETIAGGLKSLQVALKMVLGVDNYEYEKMLKQFIVEGSKYKMYIKVFCFYGMKAETSETQ
ncbi:10417_t:CDS:2 [Ambispora gerdemannii]|uniref:10417_t:CDS:1 n=1 Tax=Ambispora gerdemannii TaxID=144530 RepID=A0A9N9BFP5_9GLOM|nr:10417_t:CDS:2 [Ambispora gerdemannii]